MIFVFIFYHFCFVLVSCICLASIMDGPLLCELVCMKFASHGVLSPWVMWQAPVRVIHIPLCIGLFIRCVQTRGQEPPLLITRVHHSRVACAINKEGALNEPGSFSSLSG